eukprot:TRINITY_DN11760_c0_g1_i1.p1 TRINITY_DN11760_c0_g1~~TRINITY_DN11760_c0_g1_i1.p1  ORF type:complete len:657 (+),score=188.57 TRINITY_DN11760_c0_g1_i1:41-2011(+)
MSSLIIYVIIGVFQTEISLAVDDNLGPSYNKLSWFIHISDVHVSSWQDESRQTQLKDFVTNTLGSIKPEMVMCGGDLTEAKSSNLQASQDIAEWKTYRDIVSSRWENLPWLDIRGNHDNLNVLSRNSSNNYFARFSVMGQKGHLGSYVVPLQTRGQKFNFVAVDATWEVGMNYPFNFVGYIDSKQQRVLNNITSNLPEDSVNIFFGHYPTSVVQQSDYLRSLISHGLVYLSGHLHDLALFHMHNMYSFHNENDLELELVDWKNNRKFRVIAVDQGTFSFTDVRFGEWPVVLPTYPKDTSFMMPGKEVYGEYLRNTIRVLVFSDVPITRVTIAVDDGEPVEASQADSGPLYELAWDVTKYASGHHKLSVTALDQNDRSKLFEQQFTLDPSEAERVDNFLPNLVLRSSFSTLFHVLFLLTLLCNLCSALSLKGLYFCAQTGRLSPKHLTLLRSCAKFCLFRKLFLVCSYNKIFLPLLCFVGYMAVGPWVVGSLIEGHSGAVFAWGVLVNNQLVHSQVPFGYYFIHFAFIHPVIVLVIGHVLDCRNFVLTSSLKSSKVAHVSFLGGLLFVLIVSIYFSITFWLQFGIIGFVLGPLKTWSYIFYAAMFWVAWTVPRDHCQVFNSLFNQQDYEKKTDDAEDILNKENAEKGLNGESLQNLL